MNEKSYAGWYFLLISIAIFALTTFLIRGSFAPALKFFISLLAKVIPVLFVVFAIMVLFNIFSDNQKIMQHFTRDKGIRRWIIAIVGGIISSGPIYMWYPLLDELQKKGVKNGLIATFLYNRAVKIPLIPIMVMYFGLKYVVILTAVMISFSVLQGIIIDKLMEVKF